MGSPLTTHVLDLRIGAPAVGVALRLERKDARGAWYGLAASRTNEDGRAPEFLSEGALEAGVYRLMFDTGAYFAAQGVEHFHPQVSIEFVVTQAQRHHHVPLLLSPFGYSTYRGS